LLTLVNLNAPIVYTHLQAGTEDASFLICPATLSRF